MQAFRHKNQKSFLQKKRQGFFLSFFDVVGNCSGNKTDLRIEYAGDEEERHIIYSSFLQLHKEESTIPASFWLAVHPFFQERSSWIGLPIFVHKMAVERKGKLHDGIPVPALYIKNGKYK